MARKNCTRRGGCSNLITFNRQRNGGAGTAAGPSPLTPTLIGNFLDSNNILLGDLLNSALYTDAGGISTFVPAAGVINLLGSSGGFTEYLEYDAWITDRENLKWTDTITVNAINATTYGYGMQFHSIKGNFVTFALGLDAGGNNGTLFIFNPNGSIASQYAGAIANIAAGDVCEFILEIIGELLVKFTVNNLTQSTTANCQLQYNLDSPFGSYIAPNMSKFKRILFGGDLSITHTTVQDVGEYTYPDALFCFDSKGQGFFASGTTTVNRFTDLLEVSNPTKRIYNISGLNEVINDLILRQAEILSYGSDPTRPTKVFIGVGCNDIRFGSFNATSKAQLITLFNTLVAANFDPYICYAMPETVQDNTPFNTWANGEPTFVGKINTLTYDLLWSGVGTTPNPAYMAPLGIHPNLAGHAILEAAFTI